MTSPQKSLLARSRNLPLCATHTVDVLHSTVQIIIKKTKKTQNVWIAVNMHRVKASLVIHFMCVRLFIILLKG